MRWRVRLTSAAPLQWPEEALLPGFRETFVRYVAATQKLSQDLLALVAEALSLPPNAFARFVEPGGNQDRAKIVKYPVPEDDTSDQGVGPHFDGGLLTLVCVALSNTSTPRSGIRMSNFIGHLARAGITASRPAGPEPLR